MVRGEARRGEAGDTPNTAAEPAPKYNPCRSHRHNTERLCVCVCVCASTCIHTRHQNARPTRTPRHARMYARTNMHAHTHEHARAHARARAHTHSHPHACRRRCRCTGRGEAEARAWAQLTNTHRISEWQASCADRPVFPPLQTPNPTSKTHPHPQVCVCVRAQYNARVRAGCTVQRARSRGLYCLHKQGLLGDVLPNIAILNC